MKKKNLEQVKKNLVPLTQSEKGKLRGGFSVFELPAGIVPPTTNVNVDVAGHTCACGC